MKWSRITQFFLGIILGLAIVAGVIAGVSYLFLGQLSKLPPKPTFANDAKIGTEPKTPKPSPYPAVVIYPDGLFLRERPDTGAKTLKVLDYEQSLQVLDSSADQKWQKVLVEADDESEKLEGWVSAGNTERVGSLEASPAEEEALLEE